MNSPKLRYQDYGEGCMATYTNIEMDLQRPTPEMISLTDIAKSLSNICRWNGQIFTPFTVAQHSVMVSCMAPEPLKKIALMHDAAEAYTGDITSPFKTLLKKEAMYTVVETLLNRAICKKFDLDILDLPRIKKYDEALLEMEWQYFRLRNFTPLVTFMQQHQSPVSADVWSHNASEFMFLMEFKKLFS